MIETEIDWSNAPKWANYHAFDEDGDGFWFKEKPKSIKDFWTRKGVCKLSKYIFYWNHTVTRRPSA